MALKDLQQKLKVNQVNQQCSQAWKNLHNKVKAIGSIRLLPKSSKEIRRPSWMTPISHGYQVVDDPYAFSESIESDFAVAQREQIGELEIWSFGVYDAQVGDGTTKYLQSHLFDKELSENQITGKCKEALKKAYSWTRAKLGGNGMQRTGCTSVIVINGEKIVAANMGGYRAVVCRDGMACSVGERHGSSRWSLISGAMHKGMVDVTNKLDVSNKQSKSKYSAPVLASEKVEGGTEFVILASSSIWQVLQSQEAVNLIRHIDDPQEASECLAKEALTRMTKGNISCLVIRFD